MLDKLEVIESVSLEGSVDVVALRVG